MADYFRLIGVPLEDHFHDFGLLRVNFQRVPSASIRDFDISERHPPRLNLPFCGCPYSAHPHTLFNLPILKPGHEKGHVEEIAVRVIVWVVYLPRRDYERPGAGE